MATIQGKKAEVPSMVLKLKNGGELWLIVRDPDRAGTRSLPAGTPSGGLLPRFPGVAWGGLSSTGRSYAISVCGTCRSARYTGTPEERLGRLKAEFNLDLAMVPTFRLPG